MAKFIAVHHEGTETLFNIDKIMCIVRAKDTGCGFVMDGGSPFFVDETYKEVRQIIGNTQEEIPTGRTDNG